MTKNSRYFLILLFASCTSSKRVIGNYFKEGTDFKQSLILNKDSTFVFTYEFFDGEAGCRGRWRYLSRDTLMLKCDTESFPAQLQAGYISERTQKAIILNHNQIDLKNIILTRVVDGNSNQ